MVSRTDVSVDVEIPFVDATWYLVSSARPLSKVPADNIPTRFPLCFEHPHAVGEGDGGEDISEKSLLRESQSTSLFILLLRAAAILYVRVTVAG